MTVPVPYTWTDDELATASLFNANVRDPQSWLLGLPTFYAASTLNQLVGSSGVYVNFNVEYIKRGFTHATDDSKVYATEPGWYRVQYTVGFNQTTYGNTDNRGGWVVKNNTWRVPGGVYTSHSSAASIDNYVGGRGGYVYLNGTTDYLQLLEIQTSPSTECTCRNPSLSVYWQGRDA